MSNKVSIFLFFKPPSQPSPTGEGAETKLFPLGGNGKGGYLKKCKYLIINIIKLTLLCL